MMTRVWLNSAQAKKVVAVVGLVSVTATGCRDSSDAPHGPPAGASLVGNAAVGGATTLIGGGTVTFGLQVLTLAPGASPIEVTGVHLVDTTGMTLTGSRLAGPHRPVYQFISAPDFPPTKYNKVSTAAIGMTITPAKRGWGLLVGLKVEATGYPRMHGITVEYRIAGQSNLEQQTFPTTFVVCTHRSQLVGRTCTPPSGLRH
jgi:hypothetical protein